MIGIHIILFVLLGVLFFCFRKKTFEIPEISPNVLKGALVILTAGNLLGMAVTAAECLQQDQEVTKVERKSAEQYEDSLTLEVARKGKEKKKVTLTIPNQRYQKTEIKRWIQKGKDSLKKQILGQNRSLNHVDKNLNLISRLPDTPVDISWVSSKPELLDWEGNLGVGIPEEGQKVVLYVMFSCQSVTEEMEIPVTVYPNWSAGEEDWDASAQVSFEQMNEGRRRGDLLLPKEVNGESVTWSRPSEHYGGMILLLTVMVAAALLWGKRQEKENQRKRYQEQMIADYPDIINKFLLLLNAGMNTRKAFSRVALDYRRQKEELGEKFRPRAAYEEISAAYQEMEQGIPETEAYRRLGGRCQVPIYKTFATLLIQNLRKGNRELLDMLERESLVAFENRKRRARVLGEKAGTRLLLPMMAMLVIVFVILLFPAFTGFVV